MAVEKQLTLSAEGATDVVVWTTKLDHNLEKQLVQIPKPRQRSGPNFSGSADSWLIDIGRIKQAITIQCFLSDDKNTSAFDKKENLIALIEDHREVTISWGTTNNKEFTGNLQKVGITETPGGITEEDGSTDQERMFTVQFVLMIGTDK